MRRTVMLLVSLLAASWMAQSFADPPPHAPAHGWRKKHDRYYIGYTGREWERDYDIHLGRCNREIIGAVLGGAVGGAIGSRVADRDDRVVGTIVGAAVGALIGAKIGRELDEGDRACIGHALELGVDGRRVVWENVNTNVRYELVPHGGTKKDGVACRDFTLTVVAGAEKSSRRAKGCQTAPGVWQIQS